jgi:hypothetical protein
VVDQVADGDQVGVPVAAASDLGEQLTLELLGALLGLPPGVGTL